MEKKELLKKIGIIFIIIINVVLIVITFKSVLDATFRVMNNSNDEIITNNIDEEYIIENDDIDYDKEEYQFEEEEV
ncbi:MAG: hypothetical protein Q4E75_07165 [bacterium]|nr:hypothetical protein [bacterium]